MKLHSFTNGNFSSVWVKDREDHIVLTNYIAICTFRCNLKLLSYVIMSNHVHFVMDVFSEKIAWDFMRRLKILYGMWFSKKYNVRNFLLDIPTTVKKINDMEALMTTIAYVIANPLEVDKSLSYYGYEWSSGDCYFTGSDIPSDSLSVNSLPKRQQIRMLHSTVELPSNFKINSDGMIEKKCFVDYQTVNSLFKNFNRLSYYVSMSSKVKERTNEAPAKFKDNVLRAMIEDICSSTYGQKNPLMLDNVDFEWLIKDLNKKYGILPKQLSRVLSVNLDSIDRILSVTI